MVGPRYVSISNRKCPHWLDLRVVPFASLSAHLFMKGEVLISPISDDILLIIIHEKNALAHPHSTHWGLLSAVSQSWQSEPLI